MGEIRSKMVWLGQVLAVNDDALGAAQGFPNVLLLPGVSAVPVARAAGAAAAGLLRRLRLLLLAKLLVLLVRRQPSPKPGPEACLGPAVCRRFGSGFGQLGSSGGREAEGDGVWRDFL